MLWDDWGNPKTSNACNQRLRPALKIPEWVRKTHSLQGRKWCGGHHTLVWGHEVRVTAGGTNLMFWKGLQGAWKRSFLTWDACKNPGTKSHLLCTQILWDKCFHTLNLSTQRNDLIFQRPKVNKTQKWDSRGWAEGKSMLSDQLEAFRRLGEGLYKAGYTWPSKGPLTWYLIVSWT